jgi:beta-1,2-mannobiose phosphorylase / 1,2-beta-oligomannan phosphorylase
MLHWKKQGIIMKGEKSAALYSEKINGKHLIFIGGTNIRTATSNNLKKWKLNKEPIIKTRKNNFDSIYVEVGPPPFQFKNKLVLFFNTTDKRKYFQLSLALLDKNNPQKVLYRADKPLLKPVKPYEKKGLVNNVIFATGLVEWDNNYFLYYGGADTTINLATVTKKKMEKYLASLPLD